MPRKKSGKGGGSLPLRPAPIDPKTGKPQYWFEDWRGYKGPHAKRKDKNTKDIDPFNNKGRNA